MIELSIIIVNWNTAQLTKDCIESIRKYSPKCTYEVIVVDNASGDNSVKLFGSLRNIKVIENSKNLGFAKANNQGILAARGKNVLLLNSDTKLTFGSVDKLLEFAKSKADAAAVVPRLLNFDKTAQGSVFRLPTIAGALRQYWFGEKGLLDKYTPNQTEEIQAGVMAAFLITPLGLKKVGKLNEKYFMYFEDLDYCRKIKKSKLKIYYLKEAEIMHLHGASGTKIANETSQWRRLVPSSKIYHGLFNYYLFTAVILAGQKLGSFLVPLLLSFLIVPTFLALIRPGFFPMQDDLQAFRVYEMDRCFDDLQIPCRWVPDAGYQFGYPQFNFYPPLPYYIGALLHRLGIQYIDTVKILFIAGYLLSAIAMYILVNKILGRWHGLVAALLYSYIPYKAVEVYVRGAMSEFWAQIFFPLILLGIYLAVKEKTLRSVILLSLSIAGLLTTHLLMTIIFVPVAFVWFIYWIFESKPRGITYFRSVMVNVFVAAILGACFASFFVLPVLFERQYVHIESLTSGYFDYRQHFVSLPKMLFSMEWGYGSSGFPKEKLNLSLGIIQWIFGIVVAPILGIFTFKKNKKLAILIWALAVLELGVVFMMHQKSSFIWARLPFLWILQFPWRFMAISIFLLSILAGVGIAALDKWKYMIGVVVVFASLIYINFYVPKDWFYISDQQKFSGDSWEKQLTISIFDYLPIYATLPPWSKAPDLPEILSGKAYFSNYKKGSNFQIGTIDAAVDTKIRIPLFDFPGMEFKVDGKKVSYTNSDCQDERYCRGLITATVPAGKHLIEARLNNTPVRSLGNKITLASLGILIVLVVQSRRNAKAILA